MRFCRKHTHRIIMRRQEGHLSLELPIASLLLLIFAFLSADLGYVLYGANFNDSACHDAARAAAQTSNLTDAIKKVNAVLKSHQAGRALMTGPALQGPVVYQDFGGAPPLHTSPFVTVTTTTLINLPFAPISLMGASFGSSGNTAFTQSYTFPIVKIK
jgi:Flp pilus assembly protein TadG